MAALLLGTLPSHTCIYPACDWNPRNDPNGWIDHPTGPWVYWDNISIARLLWASKKPIAMAQNEGCEQYFYSTPVSYFLIFLINPLYMGSLNRYIMSRLIGYSDINSGFSAKNFSCCSFVHFISLILRTNRWILQRWMISAVFWIVIFRRFADIFQAMQTSHYKT